MPPHARMSLAQQLLLRALVARFWRTPYEPARLARWGTELHDRFMLPYFVWQDFAGRHRRAAARRLSARSRSGSRRTSSSGFRSTATSRRAAIEVELRQALEPWHVLGEEGARRRHGALRRFVGRAAAGEGRRAWRPTATSLTCNGRRVPLQPTGTDGEFVAGVRYRAWQPPSALHPTIRVHAPLTFDLVDTWMQRSIGGCQYHVMHPGGRNYATFPVNAFEAESRRLGALLPDGPHARRVDRAARSRRIPSSRSRSICSKAVNSRQCRPQARLGELRRRRAALRRVARRDRRGAHRTGARLIDRLAARRCARNAARAVSSSRADSSSRTASPTTSTPIRRAPIVRGRSICCR